MKRTTLANVFILSASVMVRSTATTKRSVTARACQAGDSSPTSDCQIRGLARSGRVPAEVDDHPAQLPDGSAGMFVELLAPLPVLDDRRVGVVPPSGRVRAADRRRPRCSGVVRPAAMVHSRSRVVVLKPWRLPLGVRKTPRPSAPTGLSTAPWRLPSGSRRRHDTCVIGGSHPRVTRPGPESQARRSVRRRCRRSPAGLGTWNDEQHGGWLSGSAVAQCGPT